MKTVKENIRAIREDVYGKDVREAIAAVVEQLYADGDANPNLEVAAARGGYATLGERLDAEEAMAEELKNTAASIQRRILTSTEVPTTLEEGQICIVYEE